VRIVKYLCSLFTRTASHSRPFSTIRSRIWYIINQHSRRSQKYARSAHQNSKHITRIRKKNALLAYSVTGYSQRMRLFSLSYFLNIHYNINMPDFIFFCRNAKIYTGSVASILLMLERTVPIFLSNHFLINNSSGSGVSINNVVFDPVIESRTFLLVGDIIELSSLVHARCISIFSPLFVILFHIMNTSICFFFSSKLLSTIVSRLKKFIFKRRHFFRAFRKSSIPVICCPKSGTFDNVLNKSVSYFIKSRSTSHTHMLKAVSTRRNAFSSATLNGKMGFLPFVKTIVSTNKEYVTGFLELCSLNSYWTIPDTCLHTISTKFVVCRLFALFTYNSVITRHFYNGKYISGSVNTNAAISSRRLFAKMLPVFFYTNFTRFVFETPFFAKPDAFLYSKRYFSFYSTAILVYKRNNEMSAFNKNRLSYRLGLLNNVKRIKKHIQESVTQNSIRSVRKCGTKQARLLSRFHHIFRSTIRRKRRKRMFFRRRRFYKYAKLMGLVRRRSRALWMRKRFLRKRLRRFSRPNKRVLSPVSLHTYNPLSTSYIENSFINTSHAFAACSRYFECSLFNKGSTSSNEHCYFPGAVRAAGGVLCSTYIIQSVKQTHDCHELPTSTKSLDYFIRLKAFNYIIKKKSIYIAAKRRRYLKYSKMKHNTKYVLKTSTLRAPMSLNNISQAILKASAYRKKKIRLALFLLNVNRSRRRKLMFPSATTFYRIRRRIFYKAYVRRH
jgi:hypothetical protein